MKLTKIDLREKIFGLAIWYNRVIPRKENENLSGRALFLK
jgi:hypothetical protein